MAGKRVAVTRAEGQAEEIVSRLAAAGATALHCPTIRILEPDSYDALDAALLRLRSYDWIVFTSVNGVSAVLRRLGEIGVLQSSLDEVRCAAVGPRTAAALSEAGVRVDHVPAIHDAGALAQSLDPVVGREVLLARGDLGSAMLRETLLDRGAESVDDIIAYRTLPVAPGAASVRELRRGVDAVVFTSPSTVRGFLSVGPQWRSLVGNAIVASVGPVTTLAAREAGLEVHVEGAERTMQSLVEGLGRWFGRSTTGTGVEERQ